MQTMLLKDRLDYDGSQLSGHFIFERAGLTGDACMAFIGGCDVKLDHMVDLADKKAGCSIYSREMLHFIVERFCGTLEEMIYQQRLFVSIIADAIRHHKPALNLTRKGNDLFDMDAKINISIATATPVSFLMHIGVNIRSDDTPVKTKGLKDYGIEPKTFAEEVMQKYADEIDSVSIARAKVKWVS